MKRRHHLTFLLAGVAALHAAKALASPNAGTLLPPTDPPLAGGVECATVFAGACGLVLTTGNIFNFYAASPDPFGFTPINVNPVASPSFNPPSGGANTILVGGTFSPTPGGKGVGVCQPPFTTPVSRWLGGTDGTDSAVVRVSAEAVVELFTMTEMMPNPKPNPSAGNPCSQAVPVTNGPGPWGWVRRTSDCTGNLDINVVLRGANVTTVATAPTSTSMGTTMSTTGSLGFSHGFDGQTAYADPFVRAPDGTQVVWLSGGADQTVGIAGALPAGRQIYRMAPYYPFGAETLQPNVVDVNRLPANWHSRFTSTQPYLIGQRSAVFLASCEGSGGLDDIIVVYSSRDGGKTFRRDPITTATGCGTALAAITVDIARVAPVSSQYNMVRVAYPDANLGGGRFQTSVVTVKVPTEFHVDAGGNLDNDKEQALAEASGPVSFRPFGKNVEPPHGGSVLNLGFVQPDGFGYFAAHPPTPSGLKRTVLPDTSALYWTEGNSTSTGVTGPGHFATTSYAVTSGPPTTSTVPPTDDWTVRLPLSVMADGTQYYPNFDILTQTGPPGPLPGGTIGNTNLLGAGDFNDGSFSYLAKTALQPETFRYLLLWSEPDASQNANEHYNVVHIPPPPLRRRWFTLFHLRGIGASLYSAKVQVPSRAHIRFAGKTANGSWHRLTTLDCENDDDTGAPDADGAADANVYTRTCLLLAPGITSFAALTRDRLVPANVDLPSLPGVPGFFSTFDTCGRPGFGQTVECGSGLTEPVACVETTGRCAADADCCGGLMCASGVCGTPALCVDQGAACGSTDTCCSGLACVRGTCGGPACEPDRGACTTTADCCTGLTCQSGACASAPTCGSQRAACAADADCCSGLTCTSGLCTVPACQPQRGACTTSADCCTGLNCSAGLCSLPLGVGTDEARADRPRGRAARAMPSGPMTIAAIASAIVIASASGGAACSLTASPTGSKSRVRWDRSPSSAVPLWAGRSHATRASHRTSPGRSPFATIQRDDLDRVAGRALDVGLGRVRSLRAARAALFGHHSDGHPAPAPCPLHLVVGRQGPMQGRGPDPERPCHLAQ